MDNIAVIGLDLAKNLFQVHGIDIAGQIVLRRKLRRGEIARLLCDFTPLSDRHGGVQQFAFLGAGARPVWA